MTRRFGRTFCLVAAASSYLLVHVEATRACSVCYGDPESDMARGAVWGVLVLGMIVYGVVLGMVGIGITWFVRARRPVRDLNYALDQPSAE